MAQSTLWPKFGKWEDTENVPYLEEAKKDSEMKVESSAHKLEAQLVPSSKGLIKAVRHENAHQDHGAELSAQTDFLVHKNVRQRATSGERAAKKSVGYSSSSLHPYQQAQSGNKGPSWERKAGSYANGHGLVSLTIRRSRSRSSTQRNEASVPKFGDWDEGNPSSADRYSQIFEMVREEKLSGGKVPTSWTETSSSSSNSNSNSNAPKHHSSATYESCCCFPWSRK